MFGCKENSEAELSIFSIPLKSQYKVLLWHGRADGTLLTPGFNLQEITEKNIIIKSIKFYPYAFGPFIDFFVTDGVTDWEETIPTLARLDRLFDNFNTSTLVKCTLNGAQFPAFVNQAIPGYPMDLELDNIFYKYPEKVSSWTWTIEGEAFNDINSAALDNPLIKVVVECYII